MRERDPERQLHPGDAGVGKVYLGHDSVLIDGIDASLFNSLSESNQFLISIEFAPMLKTPRPSKDPTHQSLIKPQRSTKQWDW
jgi:hypothetical protein